jgi:hypothetical protein
MHLLYGSSYFLSLLIFSIEIAPSCILFTLRHWRRGNIGEFRWKGKYESMKVAEWRGRIRNGVEPLSMWIDGKWELFISWIVDVF